MMSIPYARGMTVDLSSRRRQPAIFGVDHAWREYAGKTIVSISAGPIIWGASLVDTTWYNGTMKGGVALTATYPTAVENRWLYAQADLSLSEASRVTVAFMSNTDFPLHNVTGGNLIFKFPLSLWACTATGATRIFSMNQSALEIPGWAPPRS